MVKSLKEMGRDLKEFGWMAIPVVAGGLLFIFIVIAICAWLVSMAWNISMPNMFGFQKIHITQVIILSIAIFGLRDNYTLSKLVADINDEQNELIQDGVEENKAETQACIGVVVVYVIFAFITALAVMYSWNNILPNLLNMNLYHINILETCAFAALFNLLFGKSFEKSEKTKEEKPNNEEITDNDKDFGYGERTTII